MVDFDQLFRALYEIQGAADPNHPAETAQARLEEIFQICQGLFQASGWQPD